MRTKIIVFITMAISFGNILYAQTDKLESFGFSTAFSNVNSANINGEIVLGVPFSGRLKNSDGSIIAEIGILYGNPSGINSVDDLNLSLNGITLEQNYPNPCSGSTTVKYSCFENNPGTCNLIIINSLGQEVERINLNPFFGQNLLKIDTDTFPPGVYEYIIESGIGSTGKKMIVIK